jgi:hypothetical protein
MSILDYFDDEKKTVTYTPVASWSVDPDTGQSVETLGTPVSLQVLIWDRSQAARYFGQQISIDCSSIAVTDEPKYFFNDDGSPKKTGNITFAGNVFDIETAENTGYQNEIYPIGLKVHK